MNETEKRLLIVTPVFNDWESLEVLIRKIDEVASSSSLFDTVDISMVAINDGSTVGWDLKDLSGVLNKFSAIEVLNLSRNLGHQKAIAVALAFAAKERQQDIVIVMDSDGEDRPEDIVRLMEAHEKSADKFIFAKRKKRSEGIIFSAFYRAYKLIYRILTGTSISFGNFCLIPRNLLNILVHVSEIWNHFSAGAIRSKLPITTIESVRGKRLRGSSSMNLTTLIIHGLSAVSVQIDFVAVRLLISFICLMIFSVLSILAVIAVKFLTPFATPGWATTVVFGFTLIVIQAFFISLFLVFIILTYRTQKLFIPYYDYSNYVGSVEKKFQRIR